MEQSSKISSDEMAELKYKIQNYEQYEMDAERIKEPCQLFSTNLRGLTYEEKRFALEALQVKVLFDGESLTLGGIVPVENLPIESPSSAE